MGLIKKTSETILSAGATQFNSNVGSSQMSELDTDRLILAQVLGGERTLNDIGVSVVELNINVVSTVQGNAKFKTVTYPTSILGEDFKGYNVSFDLSWEAENCDFVELSINSYSTKVAPNGAITLNVSDVLSLSNIEPVDVLKIPIRLSAYSGVGILGDVDDIQVTFTKGKDIPKSSAINRVVEGFLTQLNKCAFDDSKYLTHLLHIGNANNKVIANWQGLLDDFDSNNDSLIIKLYEPVGSDIQPNDKVWISKVQSETIIETFILQDEINDYCPPLKGANFSLLPDNGIGYQIFDDIATNNLATTNQLYQEYFNSEIIDTRKLNINFVSGSNLLLDNFVHFSSATERIKNFWYKMQLLEGYQASYNSLARNLISLPYIITEDGLILVTENSESLIVEGNDDWVASNVSISIELNKKIDLINALIGSFDAFEYFLYTSTNAIYGFPKVVYIYDVYKPLQFVYNGYVNANTTDSSATSWYNYMVSISDAYDKNNVNYLNNNIPEFISSDYQNEDFLLFLDLIGQHFDTLWLYARTIAKYKGKDLNTRTGIPDDFVQYMLASLGWEADAAFNSNFLWEYTLGVSKDGLQKYNILGKQYSLKSANTEIWSRILSNLPYLYKHKGTRRAIKAAMACYGVPQSLLTIMEFGGARNNGENYTNYTYEDLTYSLNFKKTGEYIKNAWKSVSGTYPNAVEVRFSSKTAGNQTILGVDNKWGIQIHPISDSYANVSLYVSNSLNTTLYSSSINTVKLFDDEYRSLLVNRTVNGSDTEIQLFMGKAQGDRIVIDINSDVTVINENTAWDSTGDLTIGKYFSGSIDEFRLWKTPVTKSAFDAHVLLPDSIVGNSYTASTADLWLRYDFEYPKNLNTNDTVLNVALSSEYAEPSGSCIGFSNVSIYPYHYTPYERTVTARIPSLGFNYSDKIRIESQTLITDLSYKNRATKKSYDTSELDSSKLGFFFSPNKELNLDIAKSIGELRIDNYIGAPSNEYSASYKDLDALRYYYFERLDRNIYDYIRLVKYVDKSLFSVIEKLVPARAKVSTGLLIEPHILERNRVDWKPTTGEITTNTNGSITVNNITFNSDGVFDVTGILDTELDVAFVGSTEMYESTLPANTEVELDGSYADYAGTLDGSPTVEFDYESQFYDTDVVILTDPDIFKDTDSNSFYLIGNDPDGIDDLGFGIYGDTGFANIRGYDAFGNYYDSKKLVTVNTIRFLESTKVSTFETDVYSVLYSNEERVRVNIIDVDGDAPSTSNDRIGSEIVTSVSLLNGYLPSHYKFKNNLSEGLIRSYYKGSTQSDSTTPDGLPAVEIFSANANVIRVFNTPRFNDSTIIDIE